MTFIVIMGVSGSGKSTLAQNLAAHLNWPFKDADAFHPPANVAKMSRGEPLTDEDRWPWLDAIGQYLDQQSPCIVTCSALKSIYRARLFQEREGGVLVYLKGNETLIQTRMDARENHFMPPALLKSQLATLQEPATTENAIICDIAFPPQEILHNLLKELDKRCILT